MNALQEFMDRAFAQTRGTLQEAAEINSATIYGTFSDQQLVPVMTRMGYEDHLVTTFKASADQFPTAPTPRQKLIRPQTNQSFFIQAIDTKNPVVLTFILTDREL